MLVFAQIEDNPAAFVFLIGFLGIILVLGLLTIAGMWKVFDKAGQPGWACLIPIYNLYIFTVIAGREWWWMLLCIIPYIGFIFAIILTVDIAKSFGKSVPYGLGLAFLGFIFWPMLGFSDARYIGPDKSTPDF